MMRRRSYLLLDGVVVRVDYAGDDGGHLEQPGQQPTCLRWVLADAHRLGDPSSQIRQPVQERAVLESLVRPMESARKAILVTVLYSSIILEIILRSLTLLYISSKYKTPNDKAR